MNILRLPIATLLLALALPLAATGKPASASSVQKLLEVTKVKEQMSGMVGQIETMMRAQMQQGYEKSGGRIDDPEVKTLVDGLMDEVVAITTSEMTAPEMLEDLGTAYASVYTEDEVQAQIKFYSSAVGQKVVQRGPELMKAMMALMQQRMPAMQAKLSRVMNEFQAKVLELKAKKMREQPQPAPNAEPKPDADKKP